MAFDWTKVEGYREDMTAEEKVALMESYEAPEAPQPDMSKLISKAQFDKVASELADAKKQLRSRMTDEEQREENRKAAEQAMQQELAELRRLHAVSQAKANYLALGYADELAERAAIATTDNDKEALFDVMTQHDNLRKKALRAEILRETPAPLAGEGEDTEARRELDEYNKIRAYAGLEPVKKLPY